jgi:hypothetical protein
VAETANGCLVLLKARTTAERHKTASGRTEVIPKLRCETSSRQPGLRATWVGFEPLRPIDPTQLTDCNTRQKCPNGQIPGIEVHRRYTALIHGYRKSGSSPGMTSPPTPEEKVTKCRVASVSRLWVEMPRNLRLYVRRRSSAAQADHFAIARPTTRACGWPGGRELRRAPACRRKSTCP